MQKIKYLSFLLTLGLFVACTDNSSQSVDNNSSATAEITNEKEGTNIKPQEKQKTITTKRQKPSYQLRLQENTQDILTGEFAYMADAAYFINCSTGNKYSVVMEEAFAKVEKAYLKTVGDEAGSKVYAVFKGKIKNKKKGDQSKMRGYLTISEVISLHKGVICNTVTRRMGGMYTYLADVGVFIDCKTKRKYAVQTTGANAALEKEYLSSSNAGQAAYVELEAYVQQTARMEEGTTENGLFVTRVIGFDSSYSCEE